MNLCAGQNGEDVRVETANTTLLSLEASCVQPSIVGLGQGARGARGPSRRDRSFPSVAAARVSDVLASGPLRGVTMSAARLPATLSQTPHAIARNFETGTTLKWMEPSPSKLNDASPSSHVRHPLWLGYAWGCSGWGGKPQGRATIAIEPIAVNTSVLPMSAWRNLSCFLQRHCPPICLPQGPNGLALLFGRHVLAQLVSVLSRETTENPQPASRFTRPASLLLLKDEASACQSVYQGNRGMRHLWLIDGPVSTPPSRNVQGWLIKVGAQGRYDRFRALHEAAPCAAEMRDRSGATMIGAQCQVVMKGLSLSSPPFTIFTLSSDR